MEATYRHTKQVPAVGGQLGSLRFHSLNSPTGSGQNYICALSSFHAQQAGTPQSRGRTGAIPSTHRADNTDSLAGCALPDADNNQPNIEANMNDEWTPEMGYWPEFIPCEDWPDDVDEAYEAHATAVRNRQTHNPDYEGAE